MLSEVVDQGFSTLRAGMSYFVAATAIIAPDEFRRVNGRAARTPSVRPIALLTKSALDRQNADHEASSS
jgi:hypothetical protein